MSEIKIVSANCQGLHDLKKKEKKKMCYISTVNKNVIYYVYKIQKKDYSLFINKVWNAIRTRNVSETYMPPLVQNSGLSSL